MREQDWDSIISLFQLILASSPSLYISVCFLGGFFFFFFGFFFHRNVSVWSVLGLEVRVLDL